MAEAPADVAVGWLVDKPAGPTSHDVVAAVRRRLARRTRVGHTGTLDPFATGLLIVLAGRATRLTQYLSGLPKTYRAVVRLGARSATGDTEGPITPGGPVPPLPAIADAVEAMRGPQAQATPAFSAVKVGGEALYRKARRGEQVDAPERHIEVHDITLGETDLDAGDVTLELTVSTGTYIRQIAMDLGEVLGCGGYCRELRRTAVGDLDVADAAPVDAVPGAPTVPLARLVAHLPVMDVDASEAERVGHGIALPSFTIPAGSDVAMVHDGTLVAVGRHTGDRVRPVVVLHGASGEPVPRS